MASPLLLTPRHPAWPALLDELADPPRRLWVTGRPEALAGPAVAVVGTRRASNRGLAVAHRLGRALAVRGWTVVSGLARGVDAAAHRGALAAGGATVAVMATGADRTYPREHAALRTELEERGACITEFPAGAPPRRAHFPQRNRLVAGLCSGVVVVEAPARSGALITARQAADAGREVFAVPGPVEQENWRGGHRLLREGAQLLEGPEDVDALLGRPVPSHGDAPAGGPAAPDPRSPAAWILDRLDLDGVRGDALRARWPGTEDAWCEGLLALERDGLIRRLPGGLLARRIWPA